MLFSSLSTMAWSCGKLWRESSVWSMNGGLLLVVRSEGEGIQEVWLAGGGEDRACREVGWKE